MVYDGSSLSVAEMGESLVLDAGGCSVLESGADDDFGVFYVVVVIHCGFEVGGVEIVIIIKKLNEFGIGLAYSEISDVACVVLRGEKIGIEVGKEAYFGSRIFFV